jgi:hypothetical protein
MRKVTRSSVRHLRLANYDSVRPRDQESGDVMAIFLDEPFEIQELYLRRVFPQGGYVYLGESGWPCALRKEEFELAYQRKEPSTNGTQLSRHLDRQSWEGSSS